MSQETVAQITYFSDVLCIWAYTSQVKISQIRERFGNQVEISHRFLRVFGDTRSRMKNEWDAKGGQSAYADHVHGIAERFDYVPVHPDAWRRNLPASSEPAHLFCKAVQLLEERGRISSERQAQWDGRTLAEEYAWRCRCAFFRDLVDIGRRESLMNIAEQIQLPLGDLESEIDTGRAYAARSGDLDAKAQFSIEGSPTFLLNQGRQKLYGNVGYRIIETNIQEILAAPEGRASWC